MKEEHLLCHQTTVPSSGYIWNCMYVFFALQVSWSCSFTPLLQISMNVHKEVITVRLTLNVWILRDHSDALPRLVVLEALLRTHRETVWVSNNISYFDAYYLLAKIKYLCRIFLKIKINALAYEKKRNYIAAYIHHSLLLTNHIYLYSWTHYLHHFIEVKMYKRPDCVLGSNPEIVFFLFLLCLPYNIFSMCLKITFQDFKIDYKFFRHYSFSFYIFTAQDDLQKTSNKISV